MICLQYRPYCGKLILSKIKSSSGILWKCCKSIFSKNNLIFLLHFIYQADCLSSQKIHAFFHFSAGVFR
ncbi:hypothetical protein HMPREF1547_00925 [Blautia sp. KLE 1732]|nr:hypothetical protein HMPREF1547_00925 [Blautia sp. KLE 1732]